MVFRIGGFSFLCDLTNQGCEIEYFPASLNESVSKNDQSTVFCKDSKKWLSFEYRDGPR